MLVMSLLLVRFSSSPFPVSIATHSHSGLQHSSSCSSFCLKLMSACVSRSLHMETYPWSMAVLAWPPQSQIWDKGRNKMPSCTECSDGHGQSRHVRIVPPWWVLHECLQPSLPLTTACQVNLLNTGSHIFILRWSQCEVKPLGETSNLFLYSVVITVEDFGSKMIRMMNNTGFDSLVESGRGEGQGKGQGHSSSFLLWAQLMQCYLQRRRRMRWWQRKQLRIQTLFQVW